MQFTDPSQNFIHRFPHPLDPLFNPQSIALIGAKDTAESVGRTIQLNLQNGLWKGRLYPVNPKREEVMGVKCFPSIGELPEPVDLAIIVTPAKTVPEIINECVAANAKSAIIISAGFKEQGAESAALEAQIKQAISNSSLRIIGPNCLGLMNPSIGLNASFAKGLAKPGSLAFISQSGAMCTAVLDWSFQEQIGFSTFASIGSMIDVNWGDLIDYLGGDPNTESILIYMETIGDPRSFLSAAREIVLEKPIIVIKPGRTDAAAKAAASHTGSLTGSDAVFDAALERVGVLRVDSIAELFSMAQVLGKKPLPKGPNLTIVTNAGGPAVLATDATILNGASIAPLNSGVKDALTQVLPPAWSHSNPIDILGDAGAERYAKAAEILENDPQSDGLLFILSPQDMTDPEGTAKALVPFAKASRKPFLASWMGGQSVKQGIDELIKSGVVPFEYPDEGAWAFATMWRYSSTLKALYETPKLDWEPIEFGGEKAKRLLEKAIDDGIELLDESSCKKLLSFYQIPVAETIVAKDKEEAVKAAEKIGYPVAVKLFSKTITHKSDVGGVILNIKSSSEVESAYSAIQAAVTPEDFEGVTVQKMVTNKGYELILGSSIDPQFGPVILFGTGGVLVEVYKDSALALPPLGPVTSEHLIKKTKIYQALKGFRGKKGVDLDALQRLLIHFSQIIVENPQIKEFDINPLLASSEGFIALDARIVLFKKGEQLPKTSIRPYPSQYEETFVLKGGTKVKIRPIKPEDEPLMVAFHKELSEHSVRQRYFEFIALDTRIAHERLVRICFNDFDREMAIIAKSDKILAVGRLSRLHGTKKARLTLIVADAAQGKGLGRQMIAKLLQIATSEGLQEVFATVLNENKGMLHLLEQFGFTLAQEGELYLGTLKI